MSPEAKEVASKYLKKRGEEMADKNKPPRSKSFGSQKNHQAYAARERRPDRVLRRIIRSSGFPEAERYAEKYGLGEVLAAIQAQKVLGADGKVQTVPVRWIKRKKAEAQRRAEGFAPVGYYRGRALRRWEKFSIKQAQAAEAPSAPPAVA